MKPPKPTPRYEDELEPHTGSFPASREYARHVGFLSTLKAAAIAVVAVATSAISGWIMLSHEARTQADEGVKVVKESLDLTRGELGRHVKDESENRWRVEKKLDRLDDQQGLVLDALRVPVSKRPERPDGGQ